MPRWPLYPNHSDSRGQRQQHRRRQPAEHQRAQSTGSHIPNIRAVLARCTRAPIGGRTELVSHGRSEAKRRQPVTTQLPLGSGEVTQIAVLAVISCEWVAERGGFEPPDPCGSTVFKTAAFGHSATSPEGEEHIGSTLAPRSEGGADPARRKRGSAEGRTGDGRKGGQDSSLPETARPVLADPAPWFIKPL